MTEQRRAFMPDEFADEIERLRADAARYRFLKKHNPLMLSRIAWGLSRKACQSGLDTVDDVIDTAIEELAVIDELAETAAEKKET